jgi:hypothetical protein
LICVNGDLYAALTVKAPIPYRILTCGSPPSQVQNQRRRKMGDIVYLALGVGCFALFYLFARALSRL